MMSLKFVCFYMFYVSEAIVNRTNHGSIIYNACLSDTINILQIIKIKLLSFFQVKILETFFHFVTEIVILAKNY